ncbi:MAG: hypothetical protein AAGE84_11070 [Cyanobacteria bacterium P01_G01_bin.39]
MGLALQYPVVSSFDGDDKNDEYEKNRACVNKYKNELRPESLQTNKFVIDKNSVECEFKNPTEFIINSN